MFHEFHNYIMKRYRSADPKVNCPTITFQVTDDCCLNCSYCYQINKGHKFMTKEVMKKGMDLLFEAYAKNDPNTLINHHTKGIIIEFIGGEPLMNMDVIQYGSRYFLNKCIELDHPWTTNFRFNISTNGLLYFTDAFQKYVDEFLSFLSLCITIDGPKQVHDACRKDYDGNGSFDRAIAAYEDWRTVRHQVPGTKITISPENLPMLSEIVDFFVDKECAFIVGNPINERKWTIEEAKIYYIQLKQLADKILSKQGVFSSMFGEFYGKPLLSSNLTNWCGGTGDMLAFDPDGNAYPCLRYMPSSLGTEVDPIIIGNVDHGIYQTEKEKDYWYKMKAINRRTQSTDECFNCSVASGCSWCAAWNYQKFGGILDKRDTGLCWMQRARSLANSYYLNKFFRQLHSEKRMPVYLDRTTAKYLIDDDEYDMLLTLADFEHSEE